MYVKILYTYYVHIPICMHHNLDFDSCLRIIMQSMEFSEEKIKIFQNFAYIFHIFQKDL